jgi:hypothetical protein
MKVVSGIFKQYNFPIKKATLIFYKLKTVNHKKCKLSNDYNALNIDV